MKLTLLNLTAAAIIALSGPANAGEVNLYTSNSEDSVETALDIIREKAPDITVNVIIGGSGTLLRRIDAEQGAPTADIFWSSGFSTLANFTHLFDKYDSAEVPSLLPVLQAKDAPWTGTNTHVMVLMINESQLDGAAIPATWQDVMSDDWKGKVTMAEPANSSSAYAQLYGIWTLYGEEGVRKLASVVETQGATSGVYKAVALGEYPVGLTMEYAAQRYVAGGQDEIKLVYPTDGTFLSPEGLALIKAGPNPNDAKRVYDLFLSYDLQEAVFGISYRRPSRSDLSDAIKSSGLPAIGDVKIIEIDQDKAGVDREMLLELWAAARG